MKTTRITSAPHPRGSAARRKTPPRRGRVAPAPLAGTSAKPTRRAFPIVGIGASAGGLEALEELFTAMPTDTGMGFVVITHQHPGHTSLLPELLGRITKLPVTEATDGARVQPNHVYVGLSGGHLAILNGVLHRMETEKKEAPHLPIDSFFRSLAADQQENAICIVLSGTGADGTLGLKAIKGESGMAMVQQAQSAQYAGMPSSAAATGLADYLLPPAEMPAQLVAYAKGPYLTAKSAPEARVIPAEPMQKIFFLLRSRTRHDFSAYKSNTIRRRIERRMNLHQIKAAHEYVRFLEENPSELDTLFKELLIGVTSFFRDPEAFEALGKGPLPDLVKSRRDNSIVRVWVPGCASGEEVFSLAILFRECMDSLKKPLDLQIFGTDLDTEAIEAARIGRYPDGITVDVSPQRLERHFTREDSTYRIHKAIRALTIFAAQNVIADPPFTKLDLISCRNLLIYLSAELQHRLLPLFHYALKPGGLLFLGPSETIGNAADLFETVDKRWKIFRRKETAVTAHPMLEFPPGLMKAEPAEAAQATERLGKGANVASLVDRLLLARFAPTSVVVNDRGDIVYIHGRTGAFLEPTTGQPRHNLIEMAREGLQLELASALRRAAGQDAEVVREDVQVRTNGNVISTHLTVTRIREPEALRGLFLVSLRPQPAPDRIKRGARLETASHRTRELERELRQTKESLQSTIEELGASNEELKSTNEELQSTNEELQSTIEELETSKEEMQSLNEELTTVNTELQSSVESLSRANDDLQNLLNSTEIATLFLDQELIIRRYTEQAKRLIKLIQTDIGRPLADLVSNLRHDSLIADCREVLRTLVFKQAEIEARDGQWYLMRIMPYRTAENVIDGLVLTFVDITTIKAAEESLRLLATVVRDSNDAVTVQDFSGRINAWNRGAERMYGWSEAEALRMNIRKTIPEAKWPERESFVEKIRSGEEIPSFKTQRVAKDGRILNVWLTATRLVDGLGQPIAIATTERDITGREQQHPEVQNTSPGRTP